MEIIFVLLPISLMLALCGLCAYLWGARNGQFDDLETPALKILTEENDENQEKKNGEGN